MKSTVVPPGPPVAVNACREARRYGQLLSVVLDQAFQSSARRAKTSSSVHSPLRNSLLTKWASWRRPRRFSRAAEPELREFLPGQRPPLEAQLLDLADEIAYNTADLDDAFSAGLITGGHIADAVPAYREIHDAMETQFPGATERERFYEGLRMAGLREQ